MAQTTRSTHTLPTVPHPCKWTLGWPTPSTTHSPRAPLPETWLMLLRDTLANRRCSRNLFLKGGRALTRHLRHSIAQLVTRDSRGAATLHVMVSIFESIQSWLLTSHRAYPYRSQTPRLRLAWVWEAVHPALRVDSAFPCAHWREAAYVRALWQGVYHQL